ncbi:MAG: hypothetical protein JO030_08370, partial [Candidatus Eremiobacteraeota bacterium]|nr:hypothetical protein [Candidatus Eremiobacteraeota bacterium]
MRIISRWTVPVGIMSAAFLTACAGGGPATPVGTNQALPLVNGGGYQLTTIGARTDATCPKQFTAGCFTYSLSKGLKISWCYGPNSDPCSTTQNYKWSGDVCLATSKDCDPIEQLTATWSGPFKCKPKVCTSKGKYELDTITAGKTPPKPTNKYIYKQEIDICAKSCSTYYIGIN